MIERRGVVYHDVVDIAYKYMLHKFSFIKSEYKYTKAYNTHKQQCLLYGVVDDDCNRSITTTQTQRIFYSLM